jgi:hypothetical protein
MHKVPVPLCMINYFEMITRTDPVILQNSKMIIRTDPMI